MRKIYLLSTLMVALVVSTLNAQIVYTDITDGVPAGIDFNSDGTMEFDLYEGTNPGDYIDYTSYGVDNNIHAVGTASTSDWDVPDCVAYGFTIDASNQWEGQGDCSVDAWGAGNSTITFNQDEYLAVRFNLGGTDIYYGWIRFEMDNSGIMTYKDYAYNSTANTAINAGDMGVTTVLVTSITVQGQAGASTITAQGGTLQMVETVLPANATDNSVTWSVVNGTGSATINASGLLTATGDGTVTVKATANDASATEGTLIVTISNQSVGINEISNNQLSLFPNPGKDILTIEGENISTVEIIDINGRVVKTINNIKSSKTIDISSLNQGIYFVKSKNTVSKLVKL